jgi:hypothetical protein
MVAGLLSSLALAAAAAEAAARKAAGRSPLKTPNPSGADQRLFL